MSNKMMRTGNRSPQLPLSTPISCVEATFKDLLVMVPTCGPSTRVYRRLIAAEAEETLQLMSATDGSSTPFCFQLNRLLAEILNSCAKDMVESQLVRRLRSKTQQKLLKEFYRAVKEATNLMRLCCNQESWLMTALSMVDGKETYALRFSELLWFKNVVGNSYPGEELDWKLRWEPALVEDRSNLQENLKTVVQDTSAKEYSLAWNLSRRLEPGQGTSKPAAKNGVLYLNLEGLNVQQDKPLGIGATATVYEATWRGRVFAVKEFCQSNFDLAAIEASIATEVHHPNIVRILGPVQVREGTAGLLMELMSSNLLSYVQTSNRTRSWLEITPFQPLVAVDMMLQIAEAMRYLHEKNIAHLDLKAENILVKFFSDSHLAQEGYVNLKLVDFGCSENNVKSSTSLYKPYVGTTRYRAPEIRTGSYSRTVDMYGFALVSYQIMTGNEPFPGQRNMAEFNEKVRNGDRPKWRLFEPYPSSLKTLIEECWSGDPNARPGFATICKRLRRIKGFLITGSYDGVEDLPVDEESMDPAGQVGLEQHMLRPDSYFTLSHNAAQRIFHLKSGWDQHPWSRTDVSSLLRTPYLNKMQCDLLVQYLRESMHEVKEQMRSSPEAASVMTLTEFYRIVIACEKLILQCCDENWQRAAIWVMDCETTFLLRISELLWCTAVVAKRPWQDAAFTERIHGISRTLSEYAEKDRSLLKNMLGVATVVDSRYSTPLVMYLSQRADALGSEVVEFGPHVLSSERELIREGLFRRVYKAIMFNESVAIKEFDKKCENMAKSEASVMAKLKHPGVVPLVGVCSDPSSNPCLIMELMSGNLENLIRLRFPFPLHVCVDIILQIAEAMLYIHNAGWVHGYLNPTDILFKVVEDEHLSKAGFVVVKVADFGSAKENREGEVSENLRMFSSTTSYAAPEVPGPGENIGTAWIRNLNVVDIYSFGITCYRIVSGELPLGELELRELRDRKRPVERCLKVFEESRQKVRAGFRPTLPARCPRALASLIERCWASDPNSRPNFETICLELRHIKTMLITGRSPSIKFS